MIATIIGWLTGFGLPARFAKPVLISALIALLVTGLGVAKCVYDRSIIKAHDAKVGLANEKADRKADTAAADQRVADERRIENDTQEMRKAINAAPAEPLTPRQRARICVVLKRQARERGDAPPAGCGP